MPLAKLYTIAPFQSFQLFQPFQTTNHEKIPLFNDWNLWNDWNVWNLLIWFPRSFLLDLFFYLFQFHYVTVLVMHVEEIDLMREGAAVKNRLLDNGDMIAQRVRIDAARAYAAAGAFAADDQAVNSQLSEMSDKRRAKKSTCPFFEDDHVARFRFELLLDLERLRIDLYPLAVGRVYNVRFRLFAGFTGRVKDRDLEGARQREKFPCWLDRVVCVNTARAFIGVDKFVGLFRTAFVGEIIQVDSQQRRSLTDISFALVRCVGFQNFRCNDIFPTMILKVFNRHDSSPLWIFS